MFGLHLATPLERLARFFVDHGPVLSFAVLSATFYVAWFFAFETWVDPLLRRCSGVLVGARIVWVPAAGSFRIWGPVDPGPEAKEGRIGLLGAIAVLAASLVPAFGLRSLCVTLHADTATAASGYLMSIPMIALFVLRMSSSRPPGPARESAN